MSSVPIAVRDEGRPLSVSTSPNTQELGGYLKNSMGAQKMAERPELNKAGRQNG